MSARKDASKENLSFQNKLRQFFRKTGSTPLHVRVKFTLTDEILHELSCDSSMPVRTKAIKDLCELVVLHRLEDQYVEKLWKSLEDLLFKDQTNETRHLMFSFLQCLLKGQYEQLGMMRAHFFRVVKTHDHPDDVGSRFELLKVLTDNGKDVLYFEYEMGSFLLSWWPEISNAGKTSEYLTLLMNFIQHNSMYIKEVASELVDHMDRLCCTSIQQTTVLDCLQIMDTIVTEQIIPSSSLPRFIATLCRIVNGEPYCQMCWKVMRNLLNSHLGHSTVKTMCNILEDPRLREDSWLLRGAVFYLQMGLWSVYRLGIMHCTTASVLPSILKVAETNQATVIYEVMMAIEQLIQNLAAELDETEWYLIILILTAILRHIAAAPTAPPNERTGTQLHLLFDVIENLIEVGTFRGSASQFYEVIEECASTRSESSVLNLINHLAKDLMPTKHLWLNNLDSLMEKYYGGESRPNIRLKVLSVLSTVIKLNRCIYEDELIDGIVAPHLIDVVDDDHGIVRTAVVELLIDLCAECDSNRCLDLLDILDKLITKPFEDDKADVPANHLEAADVKSGISGLINIFLHKIYILPSSYALRIYKMLLNHLEQHYNRPKIFEECNQIRYRILNCFLKMRCDHLYRIGYPDSSTKKFRYSPYLCISYYNVERDLTTSAQSASPALFQQPSCIISYVPLRRAFKIFITCLKQEKDWEILQLVLQGITQALQNRLLILSKQGNNEIGLLVDALIAMLTDRRLYLPESLKNSTKLSRSEFHATVLTVVASLVPYHGFLDQFHQKNIISLLLKFGLVPRCARQSIMAFTICALEMRVVMVDMLPKVLLELSKISANIHIAMPLLEFLSTIAKIPALYTDFVGDQYMTVFAILLPYSNPFYYTTYIVSLAHHVIAVWFLKCRLPYRQDFVTYITRGLQTNLVAPFEETNLHSIRNLNEDSLNRKRSSSLTEQSWRPREGTSTISRPDGRAALNYRPVIDMTLLTFYEELIETLMDLMARYTFASYSALPKGTPTMDHILENGHSMTWFYGNKLITITTSGCSLKALKHGLCDNCWKRCRLESRKFQKHKAATGADGGNEMEELGSCHVTRQNSVELANNSPSTSSPNEENKKLSDKLEQLSSKLQQLDSSKGGGKQACTCWCQNWAEIYIRRATGDTAWMMRIENQAPDFLFLNYSAFDDVASIVLPSTYQEEIHQAPVGIQQPNDALASDEVLGEAVGSLTSNAAKKPPPPGKSEKHDEDMDLFEDNSRFRIPIRRSNSSPEMSTISRNPFLQQQYREFDDLRMLKDDGIRKAKTFTKDVRLSCEAIPEEIAGTGTTPPSNDPKPLTSYMASTSQHSASPTPLNQPGPSRPLPANNLLDPQASQSPKSKEKKAEADKQPQSNLGQPQIRSRGYTISVMNTTRNRPRENLRRAIVPRVRAGRRSGISPSFVFLQLYQSARFGNTRDKPLLISANQNMQGAVNGVDCVPPYETHRIGVIYVGEGQCNEEVEILRNCYGSFRYIQFLNNLGTYVKLDDVDPKFVFLGGWEQSGTDGNFTYIWQDDVICVTFHIATLMPNQDSDSGCTIKKSRLGSNKVIIIYNESGEDYDINTIEGQFTVAYVIVQPLDHETCKVTVKIKDDGMQHMIDYDSKIVSNQNVSLLVRQLAIHANLAASVSRSLQSQSEDPYASNWLDRLRRIKNVRRTILQERPGAPEESARRIAARMEDFSAYM